MALVVGFGIAQALFEAGAVMLMLPVLQYIQAAGDVAQLAAQHQYWVRIAQGFAAIGAPVTLAGLLAVAFLSVLARQVMQYCQRVVTGSVRLGLVASIRLKLFEGFPKGLRLRPGMRYQEAASDGSDLPSDGGGALPD